MNSYLKRQVLMLYPLGKKLRKALLGGRRIHPPPPLYVRGLNSMYIPRGDKVWWAKISPISTWLFIGASPSFPFDHIIDMSLLGLWSEI